jgi:hypothetical protein
VRLDRRSALAAVATTGTIAALWLLDWRDLAVRAPTSPAARDRIAACEPISLWTLRQVLAQDLAVDCDPTWLADQLPDPLLPSEARWLEARLHQVDAPLRTRLRAALLLASAGEPLPVLVTALLHLVPGEPLSEAVLYEGLDHEALWLDPLLNERATVVRWERDGAPPDDLPAHLRRAAWSWTDTLPRLVPLSLDWLDERGDSELSPEGPRLGGAATLDREQIRGHAAWVDACAEPTPACALAIADWLDEQPAHPGQAQPETPTTSKLGTAWWTAQWGRGDPRVDDAEAWLDGWRRWLHRLGPEQRERALRDLLSGADPTATTPLDVLRARGGGAAAVDLTSRLLTPSGAADADRAALAAALRALAATVPDDARRLERMASAIAEQAPPAANTPGERIGALVRSMPKP